MTDQIPMQPYYDLLQDIIDEGHDTDDRTGVGTRALFGRQIRFDLNKGFPLLTGKLVPFKLVAAELLWILSGSTNNEDLRRLNKSDRDTIWEEWATEEGQLGPIYGEQWRYWQNYEGMSIDQIQNLVDGLRERPFSRRHIVTAWNPSDLPDESISPQENVAEGMMALAPCHAFFQMHVRKLALWEREQIALKTGHTPLGNTTHVAYDKWGVPKFGLSTHLYQRSADIFLGVPFNIASYALLTQMVAHVLGYQALEVIISFGDVHIYKNHKKQVKELLSRRNSLYSLPALEIVGQFESIDDFKTIDDFKLVGYKCHPAIKADVAI